MTEITRCWTGEKLLKWVFSFLGVWSQPEGPYEELRYHEKLRYLGKLLPLQAEMSPWLFDMLKDSYLKRCVRKVKGVIYFNSYSFHLIHYLYITKITQFIIMPTKTLKRILFKTVLCISVVSARICNCLHTHTVSAAL